MDSDRPSHPAVVAEDEPPTVVPLHPEYATGDDEPPKVPVRIRKLRVLALLAGLGLLAVVSTVFGMMMAVASDLPALEEPATQNSVIVDRRGERLGLLTGNTNRILVKETQIAPVMKHAIIAIEDKRFYTNDGVDLRGIGRALYQDVVAQKAVQGGSTIAQQFVKNSLAAQDRRTLFVKLREAAMAYHITRRWTKGKILRNYLNTIYFGNGAYGIESAARTYFGRQHPGCEKDRRRPCAAQLEVDEAAMIAAVVASPSAYDPVAHPAAAKLRRDLVLNRMLTQRLIAKEQHDAAVAEPVPTRRDVQPPREDTKYPYFTSWIKQQVVDKLGGGQTGARQAFEGGLTVQTTIDARFQNAADAAITAWLPNQAGPRASLVAIDNHSGEVRAMVGGDNYNTTPFNLATQGQRQPGSAFKPFVLAEALKRGISPGSVWSSRKKVFDVPGSSEKFTVENYSNAYAGATSLAAATTTSDNSVFAEVGIKVGTKRIAKLARRMGIRTPVSRNWAITLGGLKQGVTPLDMAHAYQTFARQGKFVYGSMSPGVMARASRSPARSGSARSAAARTAGSSPSSSPTAGRRATGSARSGCSTRASPTRSRRCCRASSRAAPASGRRWDRPGRGQDRHDGELRRRLVRGLDARLHRRRVGRLPQQARADGDRVPGRRRRRRHVPGRDLQDVHGVRHEDRPAEGGRGRQGGGGRRRERHARARRRGSRTRTTRRPTEAAPERQRRRRDRAGADQPGAPARAAQEIPPAEQPTTPTTPDDGETAPSGGTAPPTGQG